MERFQSYGTIAATGSTITDATLLTYHVNIITGADDVKGVMLPKLNPTVDEVYIFNSSTNRSIKIYPFTDGTNTDLLTGSPSAYARLEGGKYLQFKRTNINTWVITNPSFSQALQNVGAAGSSISDAGVLFLGATTYITATSSTGQGVVLPSVGAGEVGMIKTIYNKGVESVILYAASGETINNVASVVLRPNTFSELIVFLAASWGLITQVTADQRIFCLGTFGPKSELSHAASQYVTVNHGFGTGTSSTSAKAIQSIKMPYAGKVTAISAIHSVAPNDPVWKLLINESQTGDALSLGSATEGYTTFTPRSFAAGDRLELALQYDNFSGSVLDEFVGYLWGYFD